jgi:uncharacterized protein YkwD
LCLTACDVFFRQALTLIQLLSHHKAGQKYAESAEAAGLAVKALTRVTGRAIRTPLSKQAQQPTLVKRPSQQLAQALQQQQLQELRPDEVLYADVSNLLP